MDTNFQLRTNSSFLREDDDFDDATVVSIMSAAACSLLLAAEIEGNAQKDSEDSERLRRCWIKDYRKNRDRFGNTQNLMKELKPNSADYKNFIRMDEDSFNFILSAIRSDISKESTCMREDINQEEKLSVTLRFLAIGENFQEDYYSKLSKSFLSTAILEVCDAIYKHLKDDFLKFPTTTQEWTKIADDYSVKWQFPNCLGALDGKHIAFRPSKKQAPLYYNYKGYHSIVLLALADAYGKFIFIDVGCNGRVSDGGVLQRSNFMYLLQQPEKYLPPKKLIGNSRLLPYVFIADNAFPLSEHMMTPYPFTTTNEIKKTFNSRLSRGRQTVERAFGILSNRFQILQNAINLREDKVNIIVRCCCVLHNFLITRSRWYGEEIHDYDPENAAVQQITCARSNKKLGEMVRKEFMDYFSNEGSL